MKTAWRWRRAAMVSVLTLAGGLLAWCAAAGAGPYPVGGDQGGDYGSGGDEQFIGTVGVPNPGRVPAEFALRMRSPNPGGSVAAFEFDLPRPTTLTVRIFDILGREVARPADRLGYAAGTHELRISLSRLASGAYLCRLRFETPATAETREIVRRIVLLK